MTAQLLNGKATAAHIKETLAQRVKERVDNGLPRPGLAVIQVGDDPASAVYVGHKRRACEQTGFVSQAYDLPDHFSIAHGHHQEISLAHLPF